MPRVNRCHVTRSPGSRYAGIENAHLEWDTLDMHHQPAGWYRDPGRPNLHRYWDGRHWIGPIGETLHFWDRVVESDRC
jgi:hypothetical protein